MVQTARMTASDVSRWLLSYASLDEEGVVSNLKLQKLLYYAQGHYMAQNNGAPLFADNIEAWTHGPVVPNVYREYKSFGGDPITVKGEPFDYDSVGPDLNDFLASIWMTFGSRTAWKLREMTHSEQPWRSAYVPDSRGQQIPHESMHQYFQGLYNGVVAV